MFLSQIDRSVPADLDVHLICDNLSTHKTPAIGAWLAAHPRFQLHFTPTRGFGCAGVGSQRSLPRVRRYRHVTSHQGRSDRSPPPNGCRPKHPPSPSMTPQTRPGTSGNLACNRVCKQAVQVPVPFAAPRLGARMNRTGMSGDLSV